MPLKYDELSDFSDNSVNIALTIHSIVSDNQSMTLWLCQFAGALTGTKQSMK